MVSTSPDDESPRESSSALGSAAIYLTYMGASDSGPPEGTESAFLHPRRVALTASTSMAQPHARSPGKRHPIPLAGEEARGFSQCHGQTKLGVHDAPRPQPCGLTPHPIPRPDRHFRAAWRGKTRPTSQDLLAGSGLHGWLAGLNYQAAPRVCDHPGCRCGACPT